MNENGTTIIGSAANDADVIKPLCTDYCGNNNNNFLNNNNNNNTKDPVSVDEQKNNGSDGGQCLSEFTINKQQSSTSTSMCSASEQTTTVTNIDDFDKHSTKSDCSHVDVEIPNEKDDEQKPNLNGLIIPSTNSGWNETDKLMPDSIQLYCDTTIGIASNELNETMTPNLKKEVSSI